MTSSFYKQNTLPTTQDSSPPTPSFIGPYKIEKLLSKGGMSLLYLGIHPKTHRRVALKVINPSSTLRPEIQERFFKESDILSRIDHPHIVRLLDQGNWEGGLYIVLELIKGTSLRRYLQEKPLSLRKALEITLQIGKALSHLHSLGIIHRDLKPENILLTEEGLVKVIDFGIAESDNLPSQEKGLIGTLNYMSPEQKENPANLSPSSDIYSLGIITYELILGKLSHGVINLLLLPQVLRKILKKALAISPQERYQTAEKLLEDLQHYLQKDLDKERPEKDSLKEMRESLEQAHKLLTSPLPSSFEIGFAQTPQALEIAYDFFSLSPTLHIFLMLSPQAPSPIEALVFLALLKGMIRTLLPEKLPFHPPSFIQLLQQNLSLQQRKFPFSLSLITLDSLEEKVSFISCGTPGQLFHSSLGKAPLKLSSSHPPISNVPLTDLRETIHNWYVQDQLTFYFSTQNTFQQELFLNALTEYNALSPSYQAKKVLAKTQSTTQGSPRAAILLTLQRIR